MFTHLKLQTSLAFLFMTLIVSASLQAEDWVSLFDGKSLDGWHPNEKPESFSVENGELKMKGGMAHLFCVKEGFTDLKNFEFKAEVKTLPGANSGVFFHTADRGPGALKKGYEAQINTSFIKDPRKTGSLVDVKDLVDSPVKDEEWFEYYISVRGKQIVVKINGKTVVDYTEEEKPTRKKGREERVLSHGAIALQAHDPESTTFFRNIQVKKLPHIDLGTHGYAPSGDVKIHYVTKGEGPLVVMIHGFPDFWYTWRKQIPALSERFQVVAIDQRGYNLSDQPAGVENYAMAKLVGDVRNVIRHFKQEKAIVIGHDWGGMVAWQFAMNFPQMTERLVILNLPHPNGLMRELANNPEQQKNSAYARFFQTEGAATALKAETLVEWVTDSEAREEYVAAMKRSSMQGMLNYYKANYPREPYKVAESVGPKVQCPVLMIHGLKDKALLSGALNDTWNWLEKDLTLVTVPDADHFVQQDAADFVTRTMVSWLNR